MKSRGLAPGQNPITSNFNLQIDQEYQ